MTTDTFAQNKLPETIVKRNGTEDRFDRSKISVAIYNALRATGEYKDTDINEFTGKLLKSVLRELKTRNDGKLHVEDVQDIIEEKLMDKGLHKTARYFIKYRFLHKINREKAEGATLVDCNQTIDEYVGFSDWRIKANANTTYSNAGLVNNTAGKVVANYWLDKIYSHEEGAAHRNGDYHIHDLDSLSGYCAGWNLRTLLSEGFNGVRSRVNSRPPKHFREALGQMANFLGILQSEWAGAQAFSSFDTFLAPYVFRDKLPYTEVKKAIRSFVYNLNVPSRWGQCVNSSYKCLRGDGKWVSHRDLKVGDSIYVVDVKTGALKKDTVTHVNVFNAPETMHRYSNEQGFSFDVTPNHRVIYKTGSNPFTIKESSELISKKGPVYIPVSSWSTQTPESFMGNEYAIDDELLEFITFIMCDGCIVSQEGKSPRLEFYKSPSRYGCDRFEELCSILNIDYSVSEDKSAKFEGSYCNKYRLKNNEVVFQVISMLDGDKHKCPKFMSFLSPRQAYIVLDTWVMLDGNFDGSHWKMQADTREIQEMLAFLTVITGKAAALKERVIGDNKIATSYTNIYKRGCRACTIEEVSPKESTVWCPTTNTGTFVCMTDEGYIFLTGNSPFTNVTIDWTVPADLREDMPIRGCVHLFDDVKEDPELIEKAKERGVASPDDMSYKHFQPEMNVIQKAYYEVMTEGDSTGQPFTFPIPTVNITEDFDWEGENVPILFENAAKIGSSYFQNFIGSQYKYDENGNRVEDEEAYKPSAVRSMCCRLQLDLTELRKRGNGLFGSAESTGSIGVVTINLARLGYRFKGDKEGLYKELDRLMNMAKSTLEKKRKLIAELYDRGLYPYTKRYLPGGFMNHFSTIGVNGGNEMIRNFTNDEQDITTEWGAKFAEDLLNHIRERMKEFQKETGNLYNLEATPAEGTTHRFAREDAKRYPDIIQAGKPGQNYYTNSSQLPSWYTHDLFKALKMQDNLQTRYTGGTVFHMYMNEAISSPEACRDIVRKVLTNFKMPYITVTPLFSVCEKHGYLRGQHEHCPLCDEEILAKYSE